MEWVEIDERTAVSDDRRWWCIGNTRGDGITIYERINDERTTEVVQHEGRAGVAGVEMVDNVPALESLVPRARRDDLEEAKAYCVTANEETETTAGEWKGDEEVVPDADPQPAPEDPKA